MRDISNERTEEAANARMRQNKYDRQVAELTLQLTRLQQQSISDPTMDGSARNSKDSSRNDVEIHDLKNQIKELSEEILKSREKIGSYSSEVATLKNRLKGAVDRAEKAEAAMEEAMTVGADSFDRMERAPPSSGNSAMRRRGVGRSSSGTTSIRSAMRLNNTERVGKAIDALDSFSVSTGTAVLAFMTKLYDFVFCCCLELLYYSSIRRKISTSQSLCASCVYHVFDVTARVDIRVGLVAHSQL